VQDEEHGGHIRCRCYLLTDDDTRQVVRQAVTVRGGPAEKLPLMTPVSASAATNGHSYPIAAATLSAEIASQRLVRALRPFTERVTQSAALEAAGYQPIDTTARRALRELQETGRAHRAESGLWSIAPASTFEPDRR